MSQCTPSTKIIYEKCKKIKMARIKWDKMKWV
jgi:hypothetical protein